MDDDMNTTTNENNTEAKSPWQKDNDDVTVTDGPADNTDGSEDGTLPCGATKEAHAMSGRIASVLEAFTRSDEDMENIKAGLCILAGGLLGEAGDDDEKRYRNILEKHFQEHREYRDNPRPRDILEMLARAMKDSMN